MTGLRSDSRRPGPSVPGQSPRVALAAHDRPRCPAVYALISLIEDDDNAIWRTSVDDIART